MAIYKLTEIDWDTDDFDETSAIEMGTDEPLWELPKEIDDVEFPEDVDDETIADWLSDTYGFCVNSFRYERTDPLPRGSLYRKPDPKEELLDGIGGAVFYFVFMFWPVAACWYCHGF